jgi:hypothetical protein
MTDDLVKRLRTENEPTYALCDEAADRIQQLETALREIDKSASRGLKNYTGNVAFKIVREVALIVRAALGEKKDD